MIVDACGTPLQVWCTPANRPDASAACEGLLDLSVLDDATGVLGEGPKVLFGDRGYGFPWLTEAVREAGWLPMLSPRGQGPRDAASSRVRYVVERTLAWFGSFRRLKFCYERWGVHFQGFHDLASVAINFKRLQKIAERRL